MTIRITHAKVNQIDDWNQAKLNEYINAGLYPAGTLISDITQPSDWNDDHSSSDLDGLETNVRGVAIVDMNNDDYTLTEAEAKYANLLILNGGDGSKTLTIPNYSTNPGRYGIYIDVSGGPIKITSGEALSETFGCWRKADVLCAYNYGVFCMDGKSTVESSTTTVTTAANTNEQIIKNFLIPKGGLQDTNYVQISFSAIKSGTATTETIRVRFGTTGTTADTEIWSNAGMATTNDNVATMIRIFRVNATTLRLQTITNGLQPFAASTVNFADVTVSNMDSNATIFIITGQNSTGAETVSFQTFYCDLVR